MALSDFALSYSVCPIYLTNGTASGLAGGTVPITEYLQGADYSSLLSAGNDSSLDDFFAHFIPLSGGRLVNQAIGEYPFANQATAANAVIRLPINITLMMVCGPKKSGDLTNRQAVLSALKTALDQHNNSGGTYSVNTPAYLYTDCVLRELTDVSSGVSHNAQIQWQWVFEKPLITLQDANAAQNNLMGKLSSGGLVKADASGGINWSGVDNSIGDASSGLGPSVSPPNTSDQGLGYASAPADSGFSSGLPVITGNSSAAAVPTFGF